MIEIDGNYLESGGQILRTSIALSAITKKPCHVFNIRSNRPKPGLMPQHLLGIQNVAKLCSGYLEGDKIGSKEIKFHPGEIKSENLHIRIETAASITLLLQSLLPVSIFAPNSLKIYLHGGGSDVPFSPTFDHFRFLANSTFWSLGAASDTRLSFTQADGNFDESGVVAVFDWIFDGTITYATPYNFEIEGVERLKIAFDTSTGVMQGYRLELDHKGVIEGQNFEMKLNQEVTINGYTLPAFYYDKPAGLPGFEWYLSITAFSTIIIVSVIIKKKRK